jgi:DNA-binding response OmpR family regulator
MPKKIFIIDDDSNIVRIATDLLSDEGYEVASATEPEAGLKKIQSWRPDLVLLDVRLPGVDGFEVCKRIKQDPSTQHIPVLMVSVRSRESDVVAGLELGADDYIRKPFQQGEMVARVKAALRRSPVASAAESSPEVLEIGPFRVDRARYRVEVDNKPVALTPKEFDLLCFFLNGEGRVFTRPTLSEKVWGVEHVPTSRTIDFHVESLRRKLGARGSCITALKGVGYRFEIDGSSAG